jgi:hypothetical protein
MSLEYKNFLWGRIPWILYERLDPDDKERLNQLDYELTSNQLQSFEELKKLSFKLGWYAKRQINAYVTKNYEAFI